MLKQPKSSTGSPGRVVSIFKATWVSRRLFSLALNGYGYAKPHAEWTPQHGKMMTHIGLAIKAGCDVEVTFRKPTEADNIADAAEIGHVVINGIIPMRGRK